MASSARVNLKNLLANGKNCKRVRRFEPVPISMPRSVKIVSISAGYAHSLLLDQTGQLYAAGYNDRGNKLALLLLLSLIYLLYNY